MLFTREGAGEKNLTGELPDNYDLLESLGYTNPYLHDYKGNDAKAVSCLPARVSNYVLIYVKKLTPFLPGKNLVFSFVLLVNSFFGIARWLGRRTRDRKVVSLNPGRSGGRIFCSIVSFVC